MSKDNAAAAEDPAAHKLPADVTAWVHAHFSAADAKVALHALAEAVDHTGSPAGARLLRCAAVGSRGRLEALLGLVADLKTDYRDVIVAGEYDSVNRRLARVRDLTEPITPDQS